MAIKTRLEILFVQVNKGVSKKSGLPYEIHMAQCVMSKPDGSKIVGDLPLNQTLRETKPGTYEAEFDFRKDFSGRISGEVIALVPVGSAKAAA